MNALKWVTEVVHRIRRGLVVVLIANTILSVMEIVVCGSITKYQRTRGRFGRSYSFDNLFWIGLC